MADPAKNIVSEVSMLRELLRVIDQFGHTQYELNFELIAPRGGCVAIRIDLSDDTPRRVRCIASNQTPLPSAAWDNMDAFVIHYNDLVGPKLITDKRAGKIIAGTVLDFDQFMNMSDSMLNMVLKRILPGAVAIAMDWLHEIAMGLPVSELFDQIDDDPGIPDELREISRLLDPRGSPRGKNKSNHN